MSICSLKHHRIEPAPKMIPSSLMMRQLSNCQALSWATYPRKATAHLYLHQPLTKLALLTQILPNFYIHSGERGRVRWNLWGINFFIIVFSWWSNFYECTLIQHIDYCGSKPLYKLHIRLRNQHIPLDIFVNGVDSTLLIMMTFSIANMANGHLLCNPAIFTGGWKIHQDYGHCWLSG